MSKGAAQALLTLLAGGGLCGTAHADRPEFGVALNAEQIADIQIAGPGDSVTYTEVSGGGTAQIKNRRVVLSSAYRVSYRIPEHGDLERSFNQDGVLRLQSNLIDQWLTADAGLIVTRSRVDAGGAAPQANSANARNLTQTYSAFVQPSLSHRFGDVTVGASARYAYTKNQGKSIGPNTNPFSDRFDASTNIQMIGSVGIKRGTLPFDWEGTVEHNRENSNSLDKHVRSWRAVGQITRPVGATVALVASGGYEKTEVSEKSPLVDPLTGVPLKDTNGNFVVDPASPRFLTYDMSGMIADAGVIWKPSRRSRFEIRAGYRYGGLTVTGLLEMKPNPRTGLTVIISDRVDSFGSNISAGLAGSPADLDLNQSVDPDTSFQNCLFGKTAGTGSCIGGALGQSSPSSYRERAVNLIFSRGLRRWNIGASAGYARRTYLDTPGTLFSLDGVVDQSFFGDLTLSGRISRTAGLSFSFRGNLFKNGQIGSPDVISGSFDTNFYRTFGRGIRMQARFGVDASKPDGMTADVSGRAQLGLQYAF